jgi:hypothetical protein
MVLMIRNILVVGLVRLLHRILAVRCIQQQLTRRLSCARVLLASCWAVECEKCPVLLIFGLLKIGKFAHLGGRSRNGGPARQTGGRSDHRRWFGLGDLLRIAIPALTPIRCNATPPRKTQGNR